MRTFILRAFNKILHISISLKLCHNNRLDLTVAD